jgi:hypothetical protein
MYYIVLLEVLQGLSWKLALPAYAPLPEVGKVTLKSNGDEALSDEFL